MISREENYKVTRDNKTFLKEFASKDGLKNYWKTNNITIIEPFHDEKAEEVISRKDVIDKTYDGSITPKTHIHETAAYLDEKHSTFVTEYAYVDQTGILQSHVVRFGMKWTKSTIEFQQKTASLTKKSKISESFHLKNKYIKTLPSDFKLEDEENLVLDNAIKYLKSSDKQAVIVDIFRRDFEEELKAVKKRS